MNTTTKAIQNKLLAYSRRHQQNHQLTLTRYFQERFLYRLSVSPYQHSFLLKGGVLIYAIRGQDSRPTMDIDFLADAAIQAHPLIISACREICTIPFDEDRVEFEPTALSHTRITTQDKYPGIRIKIPVALGNIRQRMQLDFGTGDSVYPEPGVLDYPTLLDLPAPHIAAYPVETVLAEKLEATVSLGEFNTRMKDFYDLYSLLTHQEVDESVLKEAIQRTFKTRNTEQIPLLELFSEDFKKDEQRNQNWNRFLNRAGVSENLPFGKVIDEIIEQLDYSYPS